MTTDTIKHRYMAAAAAGDAAAIEVLRREVIERALAPEPIELDTDGVVQTDTKFAALLAEFDDDVSDDDVLAKLDEDGYADAVDKAAEAIAQEPVLAAAHAVRIAQHEVDVVARQYGASLDEIANGLARDDHRRDGLDVQYDKTLQERQSDIQAWRNSAVASVLAERQKVLAERDAAKDKMANGRTDPLVLATAQDQADSLVADRLSSIEEQLQAATFLVPTPTNPVNDLAGRAAQQQHGLATLWAEDDKCAKYTGMSWLPFAEETPATQWLVPFVIPMGAVTILSGEGGIGKSRLILQLATAASLRRGLWTPDWIPAIKGGEPVMANRTSRPCITMIVNAEDTPSEAARRIVKIREGLAAAAGEKPPVKHMGIELAQGMGRVMFYQARGAVWGPTENGSTHIETTAELTAVGKDVRAQCEQMGVRVLILDPLANLYGSSENTRTHVAAYMRSWNAWAQRTGIAVVMLAHPPKSGAGFSGSTSWVGAARSAIEFKREWVVFDEESGRLISLKAWKEKNAEADESEIPKPVQLYRLSVAKTNYAYPKAYWLAESGLAFVTGSNRDLFEWAQRGKGAGATTPAGSGRNPQGDRSADEQSIDGGML